MAGFVHLTIDGQGIEVESGTPLIEAAKQAGAEIAHFCYHPKLKPDANCRMCLVEIEKMPKLQTSCSTPAAEGMVVHTASNRVKQAQEGVMSFLLGNHPLDCPECDQGGECQLQDFAHQHSPTLSPFSEEKRVFDKEYFGPLIEKEMNRCVSCLRCVRYCDEVLDVNALGSIDRGTMTQIGGFAHHELDCEFCGGCIQICPVGALTSRLSMYDYRPWQVKKTETICNYCGDGCELTLESINNTVVRTSSKLGTGRNTGDLCVRGFFGYGAIGHKDRLTRPMIRRGNHRLQITWKGAVESAVAALKKIVETHGPGSVGGVISAHCTNEEIYLFQKLLRQGIGTPHVDSSTRYGYVNAITGLHKVFGTTRLARYEDVVGADVLLVFAGEMTETNPIAALKVKEAVRKHNATLIAVDAYTKQSDPFRSHLPRLAKYHLQILQGAESLAIVGLTKALLENPVLSEGDFSPLFLEQVTKSVALFSFEEIHAATGISQEAFSQAAAAYAGATRGVLIFGRAITGSEEGYINVVRLAHLAILAKQVGRPGTGILALASENNAYGAIAMGGLPEYLPGFSPANGAGYTLPGMLDACERGEIKALYLVGENPLRSLPQKNVQAALSKLDLLICQDLFLSETAAIAHVVFPAVSFAEKEGRFTNQEGEVQRVRKAVEPVGNAKTDLEIFSMMGAAIASSSAAGVPAVSFDYANSEAVWREIMATVPDGFHTDSAEAVSQHVAVYAQQAIELAPPVVISKRRNPDEFDLQVGQALFHSGRMSTYASGLTTLLSSAIVLMHPSDSDRMGVEEGEQVTLRAGSGTVCLPVKTSLKVQPGTLFVPEHFSLDVKRLLPLAFDPTTGVPYSTRGRVTVSKQKIS